MPRIAAYLDRLASADPTPGGGSAAALVGAMGAALVAMVGRLTLASPRLAAQHDAAGEAVDAADHLRRGLVAAAADDETAYQSVVAAMALPRGSDEQKLQRHAALQIALARAAAEPLLVADMASRVVALAEMALDLENRNLVSDLGCAAEFGSAALAAAALNVRINHRFLKDAALIAEQAALLARLEQDAAARLPAIRKRVAVALAP